MDSNQNTQPADRRKIIESLFPEFLRDNQDYVVFIKLASEEVGLVSDYIELLTNLTDVDSTPEEFLEDLGQQVGYTYIDEVDPETQREIIKRVFTLHEARGSRHDLEMMAAHAQNLGYIGGDVFLPGTYKKSQSAVITFPRDTLYTWNRSKRSAYDRYPDGIVAMDGVLEVLVGYLDTNVKQRMETVKPAGVKLSFKMNVVITEEDDIIRIEIPDVYTAVSLWMYSNATVRRTSRPHNYARSGTKYIRWSGGQRAWFFVGPEMEIVYKGRNPLESILPLYYPGQSWEELTNKNREIQMQVIKSWKGKPEWSNNSVRSGKFGRSGMRTGQIEIEAPFRHPVNLDNSYIFLGEMEDKPLHGYQNPEDGNLNAKISVEVKEEDTNE